MDRLRSFVGGVGFLEAGELVRPLAIAMIGAHLGQGHDVLFPQMLADLEEIKEFEDAAVRAGGECVGIVLTADQDSAVRRPLPSAAVPRAVREEILAIVAAQGVIVSCAKITGRC